MPWTDDPAMVALAGAHACVLEARDIAGLPADAIESLRSFGLALVLCMDRPELLPDLREELDAALTYLVERRRQGRKPRHALRLVASNAGVDRG